jgi:hypothetical protein
MIVCSMDAVGALLRVFEFCWVMVKFKLQLIQVSATEVPCSQIHVAPDLQDLIHCYQEKEDHKTEQRKELKSFLNSRTILLPRVQLNSSKLAPSQHPGQVERITRYP